VCLNQYFHNHRAGVTKQASKQASKQEKKNTTQKWIIQSEINCRQSLNPIDAP